MHYYLICYDIANEKRLKKVFKLCKNFGIAIQYSVFLCHITDENLEILKSRLIPLINNQDDQVLFVKIKETENHSIAKNTISSMGRPLKASETPNCWIFS